MTNKMNNYHNKVHVHPGPPPLSLSLSLSLSIYLFIYLFMFDTVENRLTTDSRIHWLFLSWWNAKLYQNWRVLIKLTQKCQFWLSNTSCVMTNPFSYFYCQNMILLPNLVYLLLILASLTIIKNRILIGNLTAWPVTSKNFSLLCVHFSDIIYKDRKFLSLFWDAVMFISFRLQLVCKWLANTGKVIRKWNL